MAPETSSTGLWVDTRTGRVVAVEPAEGRQLVARGGLLTPEVVRRITAARAAAPPEPAPDAEAEPIPDEPVPPAEDVEQATAPAARETATTSTTRKRR